MSENEVKNTNIIEYGADLYNDRYKYGYNWGCYMGLAKEMIDIMQKTGCKDKEIIDIGCGVGWFTDYAYFNVSRNITGIDFSEKAINFHGRRMYPAPNLKVANIYEYDYTGFEIAILMEVLEHLEKDLELIGNIKPGTKVYATVPFENLRQDFSHVREYKISDVYKRYSDLIDITDCKQVESYIVFYGVKK